MKDFINRINIFKQITLLGQDVRLLTIEFVKLREVLENDE